MKEELKTQRIKKPLNKKTFTNKNPAEHKFYWIFI